jgi:hypothetical protein
MEKNVSSRVALESRVWIEEGGGERLTSNDTHGRGSGETGESSADNEGGDVLGES